MLFTFKAVAELFKDDKDDDADEGLDYVKNFIVKDNDNTVKSNSFKSDEYEYSFKDNSWLDDEHYDDLQQEDDLSTAPSKNMHSDSDELE